jgi:hypothetical protein
VERGPRQVRHRHVQQRVVQAVVVFDGKWCHLLRTVPALAAEGLRGTTRARAHWVAAVRSDASVLARV